MFIKPVEINTNIKVFILPSSQKTSGKPSYPFIKKCVLVLMALSSYILKIILMTFCFYQLFVLIYIPRTVFFPLLLSFWVQGTMTSSSSGHSSDDRWYELLEPPPDIRDSPPPLPARLSAFQPINEFKVGEKVTTCLLKAERSHELRRQLERSPHDYHLLTRMPKVSGHEHIAQKLSIFCEKFCLMNSVLFAF